MANANSFADVINRQNGGNPIVIQSSTTIHQSFLLGGQPATLNVPNPMVSIDAGEFFPNLTADGRPFMLQATGKVTGGEKYQIDIVLGTGLVNVVASTGLAAGGLTADNWGLQFLGMWDSSSLFLRGLYWGWIGSVQISQAGIVTTSLQPANLAALQFNVAATIATANASAVLTLTDFSGEFC